MENVNFFHTVGFLLKKILKIFYNYLQVEFKIYAPYKFFYVNGTSTFRTHLCKIFKVTVQEKSVAIR